MRIGFAALVVGYVLSQFYRACLAVLTPILGTELGADAADLSLASGIWFLTFAAMQFPVGWALDKIGPRQTAAGLLAIGGGGGTVMFALASSPVDIQIAMGLIGIGCSPVLMASYYILARSFPAAMFATLGGAVVGIGTMGNLASATPLAWAAEEFGWRNSMWVLCLITMGVAAAIALFVRNPAAQEDTSEAAKSDGFLQLFKIRAIWLIAPLMFVSYASAAGLRGLWVGPFMQDIYGLDAAGIGYITLAMGLGMSVGGFIYGPLERMLGTRKWVVLGGSGGTFLCLSYLAFIPDVGVYMTAGLLALIGVFGMSFTMMMAHGRSFIPAHLTGRGVAFLNLCSIAGVGVMQSFSAQAFAFGAASSLSAGYSSLFLFFALPIIAAGLVYLMIQDRVD